MLDILGFSLRRAAISLVVIAFGACASVSSPPLRVASSGDYRPFSIATNFGDVSGFDTAIAHRFARDSGRTVTFVPLRWPQLIDDARADRFDVAMSGVTMRADRTLDVLFSRPYAVTGAVVIVRRDRAGELDTLEAIDRQGARLAVNRGGHLERVTRARFRQATIVTVDDNTKLADLVLAGEVDAVVSEEYEAAAWPQETLVVLEPFTRDRKAYAVVLARADLLDELNAWLAARESDGWLNDERRRWLGERALWTPEQACFEAIAAAIDMRIQLMPWVAAAKRERGLPIEDRAQEERVVEGARKQALEVGLTAEAVAILFRDLIVAAKDVQRTADPAADVASELLDLDLLRAAVAVQGRQMIVEASRCRPALRQIDLRPQLEAALRAGIPGLTAGGPGAARLASRLSAL